MQELTPRKILQCTCILQKRKQQQQQQKQDTVLEYNLRETENSATFSSLNFGNTKYTIAAKYQHCRSVLQL